jgi:hypothetical protein
MLQHHPQGLLRRHQRLRGAYVGCEEVIVFVVVAVVRCSDGTVGGVLKAFVHRVELCDLGMLRATRPPPAVRKPHQDDADDHAHDGCTNCERVRP